MPHLGTTKTKPDLTYADAVEACQKEAAKEKRHRIREKLQLQMLERDLRTTQEANNVRLQQLEIVHEHLQDDFNYLQSCYLQSTRRAENFMWWCQFTVLLALSLLMPIRSTCKLIMTSIVLGFFVCRRQNSTQQSICTVTTTKRRYPFKYI